MILANDVGIPIEFVLVGFSLLVSALVTFSVYVVKTMAILTRTLDRVEQAATVASARAVEAGIKLDHIHDCFETRIAKTDAHLVEHDVALAVLDDRTKRQPPQPPVQAS